MNIRSFVMAVLAVASFAFFSVPATQAAPCITHTIFGDELRAPICSFNTISPLGGGAGNPSKIAAVKPPIVTPVVPTPVTEVPSTPLEPGTLTPGSYIGTLAGTEYISLLNTDSVTHFENFRVDSAVTLANGDVLEAGYYSGIGAPSGHIKVSYTPFTAY